MRTGINSRSYSIHRESGRNGSVLNKHQPVMTIFAGIIGAGKSTISLQMRELIGEVVDPNQIAMRLNPEDPRSTDLSAGKEAIKRIRLLINANHHFAVETTLSGTFF